MPDVATTIRAAVAYIAQHGHTRGALFEISGLDPRLPITEQTPPACAMGAVGLVAKIWENADTVTATAHYDDVCAALDVGAALHGDPNIMRYNDVPEHSTADTLWLMLDCAARADVDALVDA